MVAYLPKNQQDVFRRKLQSAYAQPTHEGATAALQQVRRELAVLNLSAVNSLDEGLEETLTLHKLGLIQELGTSFKTTNCLESIASVRLHTQRAARVDGARRGSR